jgi:hypothetical protein
MIAPFVVAQTRLFPGNPAIPKHGPNRAHNRLNPTIFGSEAFGNGEI